MLVFTLYSVQGSWQGLEGQTRSCRTWASAGIQGREYALGWEPSIPDVSPHSLPGPPGPTTRTGKPGRPGFTQLGLTNPRPHFPQATGDFHTWISRDFFGFCMPDSFSSV